jgi:hypothetical protein
MGNFGHDDSRRNKGRAGNTVECQGDLSVLAFSSSSLLPILPFCWERM